MDADECAGGQGETRHCGSNGDAAGLGRGGESERGQGDIGRSGGEIVLA